MDDRFVTFTISISKLNKLIQKLKTDGMKMFALKGVHTLCLYQLIGKTDGMTATQITSACDLDPALVSRTLGELAQKDLIKKIGRPGKYHAKYCLTVKGEEVAAEAKMIIAAIQETVDMGISKTELDVFYKVLSTLIHNFEELSDDTSAFFHKN